MPPSALPGVLLYHYNGYVPNRCSFQYFVSCHPDAQGHMHPSYLGTLDMFRTSRTSNPITNSSRELIMSSTAGKLPLPSPGCDPTIHEARAGSESDREAFCKEVDAKLLKWQHSRDNIEEETTRFTFFDLEDLRWVIHTP